MNLGILGCGAITKGRHLPAAVAHPDVRITMLVDRDVERAKALREFFGLDCLVSTDFREVVKSADGVINALPNHLHGSTNMELLSAGIHVLCEKPLATTAEVARACCENSDRNGTVLAVVMHRRFYESTHLLRLALEDGILGPLLGYEWDHGVPFAWDTASGFYFSRAESGGGVLLDEGVHLIDCLTHWFGPVKGFEYHDDNWGGGIEANVILDLQHASKQGEIPGRMRLSRTYTLRNRLLVRGANASAEILRSDPNTLIVRHNMAGERVSMSLRLADGSGGKDAFLLQLDNFIHAVQGVSEPVVNGWKALETIELIESCYSNAARIPEPWFEIDEKRCELTE
jgi:predicted dehydrogenase